MHRSKLILFVCLAMVLGGSATAFAQNADLAGTWTNSKRGSMGDHARAPHNQVPGITISVDGDSVSILRQNRKEALDLSFIADGQERLVNGRSVAANWESGKLVISNSRGWSETWELTGPDELTITRQRRSSQPIVRVLTRQ